MSDPLSSPLNDWAAISTICTAVITGVYAGLTYFLVRSNNQLVKAAIEQQVSAIRPIVQVRIQSRPGSPIFQMVIANAGSSSAENLRLQIDPDLITFHGKTQKDRSLAKSSLFQKEIKHFPPRTELTIDLGLSFDFFSEDPDIVRKAPPQFAIRAVYDGAGREYDETTEIDLDIFRPATAAKYGMLAEIADLRKQVERIADLLAERS